MSRWEELDNEKKEKLGQALRQVDLLACLAPEQLTALINESKIRDFDSGEIILLKGEISEALYVIGSGQAIVSLPKDPKPLGGSNYFGEMSLFLKRPVICSVKAGEKGVRVLALPGKILKEMIDATPKAKEMVDRKIKEREAPPNKDKKKPQP